MEKDSALYQLMDTRMHSVMNGIVSSDGEYQAILRKSDIYSGELDRMDLSKEIRLLIDRYVSEQNAHSTCAIDPGLGCSPTCLALQVFQLAAHIRLRGGLHIAVLHIFLGRALPRQQRECRQTSFR